MAEMLSLPLSVIQVIAPPEVAAVIAAATTGIGPLSFGRQAVGHAIGQRSGVLFLLCQPGTKRLHVIVADTNDREVVLL